MAPGSDQVKVVFIRQDSCRPQGRKLSATQARHYFWFKPQASQDPVETRVIAANGRLGIFGFLQGVFTQELLLFA